jgi:hypothetical protein
MGSGNRFSAHVIKGFGLGLRFDRFPHEYSFDILFGCFTIYIGIGKGYDEL